MVEFRVEEMNDDAHRFEGSHGWWRVDSPSGPDSQPYGRFARGLDPKVEGMDAIYLDIQDRFFRNKPLSGVYSDKLV